MGGWDSLTIEIGEKEAVKRRQIAERQDAELFVNTTLVVSRKFRLFFAVPLRKRAVLLFAFTGL